jgi:uncharacterized protein (TIGR03437 family)
VFIRANPWPLFLVAASYAAELSLPAQPAAPGSSLPIAVAFASQSGSVTAIQFDLQYDSVNLSLSVTVGAAARAAAKSLSFWDLAPGQRRFVIGGLNQNPLADGVLANLFANVTSTAPAGAYALKLLNVVASGPSAQAVAVQTVDGAVTVHGSASSGAPLQSAGVLSAASLLPGPVAPGEIVTLLGAGLSGVTVLFDGTAAPLLYSASNQVNAIAPYSIQNKTSTQLQLIQQGQPLAALSIPVVAAVPAIFTVDGSGVGPGAILNQDYSLNSPSNPAAAGSAIMIFATGAGQTNPPGVDGQLAAAPLPQPVLPVSVQIAGLDAQVLYAGAAPGLIAGMLQVNCLIPAGSPSGLTVPIVLTIGTTPSQSAVTLAIQ